MLQCCYVYQWLVCWQEKGAQVVAAFTYLQVSFIFFLETLSCEKVRCACAAVFTDQFAPSFGRCPRSRRRLSFFLACFSQVCVCFTSRLNNPFSSTPSREEERGGQTISVR